MSYTRYGKAAYTWTDNVPPPPPHPKTKGHNDRTAAYHYKEKEKLNLTFCAIFGELTQTFIFF